MVRLARWCWLVVLIAATHPAGPIACLYLAAQETEQTSKQVASLKDQLEKGLRARRPIEFQFVQRIAELVETKQLSREFVLSTFNYTVRRYAKRKYLVTYFEQILRQRAAKDKITALDGIPTTIPKLP